MFLNQSLVSATNVAFIYKKYRKFFQTGDGSDVLNKTLLDSV